LGRGKHVTARITLSKDIIEKTLLTTQDNLINIHNNKNMIGSAIAGSIGGFNAHATNMVAAIFLATGQDIAQIGTSSSCLVNCEKNGDGLDISVSMPCLEIGTIGGGTELPTQKANLTIMNCKREDVETGTNTLQLASNIASIVLAGEINLLSALSVNHLIKAHMDLNRKNKT
jgi:hydroxymethylglutaryl-CoA reductase (NADPH)